MCPSFVEFVNRSIFQYIDNSIKANLKENVNLFEASRVHLDGECWPRQSCYKTDNPIPKCVDYDFLAGWQCLAVH